MFYPIILTIPTAGWVGIIVGIGLLMLAGGFFGGIAYRKKIAEAEIGSAEQEAKRLVDEAVKLAETKKKESVLEAKEEILAAKKENEREIKERRNEVTRLERRVASREEQLDRKIEQCERKEAQLDNKIKENTARGGELANIKNQQLEKARKHLPPICCWEAYGTANLVIVDSGPQNCDKQIYVVLNQKQINMRGQ